MNRRRFVQGAAGAIALPAFAGIVTQSGPRRFSSSSSSSSSSGGGGDPLSLPLVQESDNIFTHIGEFDVPGGDFESGGAALSINGNQMYMSGLRTARTLGRFTIPSLGGTGSTTVAPVAISGTWGTSQTIVSGSLVVDGALLIACSVDYDADTTQGGNWIKRANLSVGSQGSVCTMSASNGAPARRLSQALGHVPAAWQSILGGRCFTTGCRLSIVSYAQCGYGFATFDPDDVVSGGGSVPTTVWLDYDLPHALDSPANGLGGDDWWSESNAYLGTAIIPEGSRSLLFITCHGYGPGTSPPESYVCRPGSSVGNAPYRIQVVAYDLAEVVAAANTYDPEPYAFWTLDNADVLYNECVGSSSPGSSPGNFCYDPVNGRLYGMADGVGGWPNYSAMQVWSVGSL